MSLWQIFFPHLVITRNGQGRGLPLGILGGDSIYMVCSYTEPVPSAIFQCMYSRHTKVFIPDWDGG